MTPREYQLLMKAYNLRTVDRKYWIHMAAYQNFRATGMKPAGKKKQVPIYKTFKSFFDYESELKSAAKKKKKSIFDGISKVIKHE